MTREDIVRYLRKAPTRRSQPPWSIPTEAWLLILLGNETKELKAGIGYIAADTTVLEAFNGRFK